MRGAVLATLEDVGRHNAVGEEGGLYFVEIRQRLDKCGFLTLGPSAAFDWFELYAVSPDGKVLARYPYFP
jgi:hypothetical protein